MNSEDHVTGVKAGDGIWMGAAVIQQLGDGCVGDVGGFGLLGGDGVHWHEQGVVNGPGVTQEGSHNFLDAEDAAGVQGRRGVGCQSLVVSDTKLGRIALVWGMLRANWWRVFEAAEDVRDASRHGQVDCAIFVVPFDGDAAAKVSGPVGRQGVVFSEGCFQVEGVFFAHTFNSKIVHNEGERDWSPLMLPQAMCVFGWMVTMFGEAFGEQLIGK